MSDSHFTRVVSSPQGHQITVHGHVDDDGRQIIQAIGTTLRVMDTDTLPTTHAMIGAVHRVIGHRRLRTLDTRRTEREFIRTFVVR